MAKPVLTVMREAVRDAIRGWPTLSGAFARTWFFEAEDVDATEEINPQFGPVPAIGDLPALAVYPAPGSTSGWVLNQTQEAQYVLQIAIWTPFLELEKAEYLWEELMVALYQSRPNESGNTYLQIAMGAYGEKFTLGTFQPIPVALADEGPLATVWLTQLVMRKPWNPKTRA